jgi:hypothetical protein
MSTTNVIIGLVIGVLLCGAILLWRNRYRDVFGVVLVLGIAALAAAVTVYRIHQYRETQATAETAAPSQAQSETPPANTGGGSPQPPVILPSRPPLIGGPTGAAAPPAVQNPYAGDAR